MTTQQIRAKLEAIRDKGELPQFALAADVSMATLYNVIAGRAVTDRIVRKLEEALRGRRNGVGR